MHNPIYHIKDGYFFEVPKFLWQHHWQKLTDVPGWLTHACPDVKNVAEFNHAMAGKILIPQPFGSPRNLYEAGTGFCISRYMVLEFFAAALLVFLCVRLAKRTCQGDRARGTFWNMLEGILFFLRDYVARPAIGHGADRFVPLLWTMFLFILMLNLFGLVPVGRLGHDCLWCDVCPGGGDPAGRYGRRHGEVWSDRLLDAFHPAHGTSLVRRPDHLPAIVRDRNRRDADPPRWCCRCGCWPIWSPGHWCYWPLWDSIIAAAKRAARANGCLFP